MSRMLTDALLTPRYTETAGLTIAFLQLLPVVPDW